MIKSDKTLAKSKRLGFAVEEARDMRAETLMKDMGRRLGIPQCSVIGWMI